MFSQWSPKMASPDVFFWATNVCQELVGQLCVCMSFFSFRQWRLITPIDSKSATWCVVKSSTNGVCSQYRNTEKERFGQPRNMATEATHTRTHTLICRCTKWDLAMLSDTWQSHGSVQKHGRIVHKTTDSVTDLEAPAALWLRLNVLTGTDCLLPEVSFWGLRRQKDKRLFEVELRVLRAKVWFNHWPHLQTLIN